jgi:hypothetical protein
MPGCFFCILERVRIYALFDFTGRQRMLFAALLALLLSGCSLVRTTAPVEPASREYKLLLDPARFGNARITASIDELDRLAAAAALSSGVAYEGSLREPARTRSVAFLDVPGKCTLRNNDLVLRLRSKGSKTTATLKYRTPSLSAITAAGNPLQEEARGDVEVDLKPPHESIYSQSLSKKIKPGSLETLGDLYALFPVTASLREAPDTRLAVVGLTPVREEVRGKVVLDLGSGRSMSLSLWYRAVNETRPVIAELSFKYAIWEQDRADEKRARRLFETLQQLEEWVSPLSMTKTAFIYAASPGFCEQP